MSLSAPLAGPPARGPAPVWLYLAIAIAAATSRLLFVWLAPAPLGGDDLVYLRVAENIFQNACVSMSDPATGACAPHWGGNHFPGYPAFIAVSFVLLGHTLLAPLLLGVAVSVAALLRLVYAVQRLAGSQRIAAAAGLVAALSPQQVAWPRFVLTEALFLAIATWLCAELLLSLAQRRLRVVPIALAVAAAAFVRHDGILFAAPVAVCALALQPPRIAARQGVVLAVLIALPLAAWMARSVAVGLPSLPPTTQTSDGAPAPTGFIQWRRTWEVTSYQAAAAQYPVNTRFYESIVIDAAAFRRKGGADADEQEVQALLAELASYSGRPFPPQVDEAFGRLAAERRTEDPLGYWVWLPLRRATHMWFDPLASGGWPAEARSIGVAVGTAASAPGSLWRTALNNPGVALTKAGVSGYRVALFVALVALVVLVLRGTIAGACAAVVWMAAAIAAARTVFFVALLATQARYLVAAVPFIEIAVVLGAASLWPKRRWRLSHARAA